MITQTYPRGGRRIVKNHEFLKNFHVTLNNPNKGYFQAFKGPIAWATVA